MHKTKFRVVANWILKYNFYKDIKCENINVNKVEESIFRIFFFTNKTIAICWIWSHTQSEDEIPIHSLNTTKISPRILNIHANIQVSEYFLCYVPYGFCYTGSHLHEPAIYYLKKEKDFNHGNKVYWSLPIGMLILGEDSTGANFRLKLTSNSKE